MEIKISQVQLFAYKADASKINYKRREVRNWTETQCPVVKHFKCFIYRGCEPTIGSSVATAEFGKRSKTSQQHLDAATASLHPPTLICQLNNALLR